MEKKTSKVVKVSRAEKDGSPETFKPQDGNVVFYKFLVAFENKDWGEYWANKDVQDYFVEGKEVAYMIEPSGDPKKPSKIKKPPKNKDGGGGSPRDVKKEIVSMTMSYALRDAKNFGITSETDVLNFHERITRHCWQLIDEVQ